MITVGLLKRLIALFSFLPCKLTSNSIFPNAIGGDFYLSSSYNVPRQLDNCAAFYFSNLSTNFGYNHYGTCGFVAMASLLSYYDSYLNDEFIEDKFEVNTDLFGTNLAKSFKPGSATEKDEETFLESPGIKYDEKQMLSLGSSSNVSNSIKLYANNGYFQFYLMDLAYQQNFKHLEAANKLEFDMNNYELQKLLYKYITTRSNFLWTSNNAPTNFISEVNFINKNNQSKNEFISTIIDNIKNGIPSLTLINNTNENNYYGHYAIAYDYQEGYEDPEDGIIFNVGLSDEHGDNVTSIPFYYIKKYTQATQIHSYFNINEAVFNHTETNNYYDSTNKNKTSCMCELSVHPNHTHVYMYNQLNSTQHELVCKCLLNGGVENHEFVTKTINKINYKYCPQCSYLSSSIFEIGGV